MLSGFSSSTTSVVNDISVEGINTLNNDLQSFLKNAYIMFLNCFWNFHILPNINEFATDQKILILTNTIQISLCWHGSSTFQPPDRYPANISWSSRHVLKTPSTLLQRHNFTSSKTSSRRPTKTSWTRLQDVFKNSRKTSSRHLGRRKIVTLKTSSRRLQDMSWRCLKDISWRRLQDVSKPNKIFTGDICI